MRLESSLTVMMPALLALALAGAARADTIALVWQGSGTSTTVAPASATITADIVLTISSPNTVFGVAWSISYDGGLEFVLGAGSCGAATCPGSFTPGSPGWFDLTLLGGGPAGPGPSYESSWAQDSAGASMPTATVTVGTVAFHVIGPFGTATPGFVNNAKGDGCFDSAFVQGACNHLFGFGGTTVVVPEPATLGFVSLGLAGLALMGRRSRC